MKARPVQGFFLLLLFAAFTLSPVLFAQTSAGELRGQVTDPSGATVAGATILLTTPDGAALEAATDKDGAYEFKNLAPGKYTLKAVAEGFGQFMQENIVVGAALVQKLNIALAIEVQEQKVMVNDSSTVVDVNPANNASTIVLKATDLEAFSDDPDEFQSDLQALAGPSAGPNGGQIYIDGFTGGQLPPKSSIREIRLNQNPFSAEYDKLGFGRVEILTKPGTDTWHGQVQVNGSTSALNSRNPFLGSAPEPGYDTTLYSANVGGPLNKKASFFFSLDHRNMNNLNIVNATTLDPANLSLPPALFTQAVPNPHTRTNLGPRFDYQLGPNNTLTIRYQYYHDNESNDHLGGLGLAAQGVNSIETEHTLQVSDTQILSPRTINESRFQYVRDNLNQVSAGGGLPFTINDPTVNVQGAFLGGPNVQGNIRDSQNSYELQNYTSMTLGTHLLRFGVRLRARQEDNSDTANFNGQFTFGPRLDPACTPQQVQQQTCATISAIDAYQRTLVMLSAGDTPAMILAAGGGASQYSLVTGTPRVTNTYLDVEPYLQDDWRVRPNITLSYGLRYEGQTDISDHKDFAPRLGVAWGVGGSGKKAPKLVLRAGFGIFYDRFTQDLVLQQQRLDGLIQNQTTITNPTCFPSLPTGSSPYGPSTCLTGGGSVGLPTTYQVNQNLRAPYTMQSGISLERQLSKNANLAVTYLNSRGVHAFLISNINSPLPCTVANCDPATQPRPVPSAGNIYEYRSEGIFKQNQLIVNSSVRIGTKLSLFGYYTLNYANGDTAGPSYFTSNSYNLSQDYGRASFDIRHRLFFGGTLAMPYAFRLSPFLIASSGIPFNVTTGQDNNGDSIFNDRPAFGTCVAGSGNVNMVQTKLGCFNTAPTPGEALIPINFATSPGRFAFNVRLSKSFGFGAKKEGSNANLGGPSASSFGRLPGGGPGGGRRGGAGDGFGAGNATNHRYGLTFSIAAQNLFNNVNVSTPVGVLGSRSFGLSNGLAGRPYSSSTSNRRIELQALFTF